MFNYLKKYWKFAVLAPLCMMGEVLMDLLQPQLMQTIVDDGVLGVSNNGVGNMNLILSAGGKMTAIVLIGACCGIASGLFAQLCAQNFGNDMRKDCFARIMNLSFEQTDRFSTGSLVTRVTNDITQLQNLVTQILRMFVRTGMLFIGGIVCLVRLDLSFGVITACALPFVAFCIFLFLRKSGSIFETLQEKLDNVNNVMAENITGTRVVKAYVREDHEIGRFASANNELIDTQLNALMLFSYMMPIVNILMNLAVLVIIYVGGLHVKQGSLTPGCIMAAITYTSQISHSLLMLANIFQTISRGVASEKRVMEVLKTDPVIRSGSAPVEAAVRGEIEFRNVSFAYNDAADIKVLHDINLKIAPGETLGIMGSTGCGKSSLVNLIPRFYDPTSGEVLLDGVNVKEYDLTDLREKVAVALQKSELFNVTIKENILWGNPNASDAEVETAAKRAQAWDFIQQQPQGLDTMVAEKGMSLSGGQKQRIAITRAILKPAEVLIFDDATSALDLKTEANLYAALNEAYPGMTKVIVAQRIASVRNADRIAVLEGGTIAAIGSHDELMESSQIYRDIYNSQLKGAK